MKSEHFYLGCPVWACPNWRGTVYSPSATRKDWLRDYSKTFQTVEGNSTFYAIPQPETVKRWVDETTDGFKFALKFPRLISHEQELVGTEAATDEFLGVLEILREGDRLGPCFLQLSPRFGPAGLSRLANYLGQLPTSFPLAVEVRHHGFFEPSVESELNDLLTGLQINRVIFDSRPLYSMPPTDEYEQRSQQRKPKTPICMATTGANPLLRLIGRNDVKTVTRWIEEWSAQTVDWVQQGLTPYVFTHTPDDRYAPLMAREFMNAVADRLDGQCRQQFQHEQPEQLRLF